MQIHSKVIFPALQKLVARNSVFETYIAQYALMEQNQLTAIEFEHLLTSVAPEDLVDGFIILEPSANVVA